MNPIDNLIAVSTVFASGSTDTINRESYQNKKPSLFAINGDADYIPSDDDNVSQVEQNQLHQSAPSASSQFSSNKRKLSQMDFDDDTISINTQQLVKKKFVVHRDHQDAENHQSHEELNELMSENCHFFLPNPL